MIFQTRLKAIVTYFFRQYKHKKTFRKDVTDQWLLFTLFTAAYAQKSQNSDFAHVCLGFITQKQLDNTSRRQRVNRNLFHRFNGSTIFILAMERSGTTVASRHAAMESTDASPTAPKGTAVRLKVSVLAASIKITQIYPSTAPMTEAKIP